MLFDGITFSGVADLSIKLDEVGLQIPSLFDWLWKTLRGNFPAIPGWIASDFLSGK